MATPIWQGGALAIADVWTLSFGGTLEVGDKFLVTIGSKTFTWTGNSTSVATAATNFVEAWNNLSLTYYPEFRDYTAAVTSGGSLTLTRNDLGVPGSISVTTTESDGTPADSQTFSITNTTPAEGPNFWSVARNWSTNTVPVTGDSVRIENSTIPILYGISQSGVILASLYIARSYRGTIGLPKHNGRYYEYLPDYLAISATLLDVRANSGRIKINTGSNATAATFGDSGIPLEQDVPAILWKGAHASNVVELLKGSLGVAFFADESATVSSLLVGQEGNAAADTKLVAGSGLTYTTFKQNGGNVTLDSGGTTITRNGGELRQKSGNVVTLNNWGGTWYYTGTGTVTEYHGGSKGRADFSGDNSGRAVTTCNLYAGTQFYDPMGTVTFGTGSTEKIKTVGCRLQDVQLDLGYNRQYLAY